MDELGFPYKKVEEAGIISPVLSVQCDYKAMTYFGDRVCIDTSAHCYLGKNVRPSNIKKELPELYAKMMEELQKVEKK